MMLRFIVLLTLVRFQRVEFNFRFLSVTVLIKISGCNVLGK